MQHWLNLWQKDHVLKQYGDFKFRAAPDCKNNDFPNILKLKEAMHYCVSVLFLRSQLSSGLNIKKLCFL